MPSPRPPQPRLPPRPAQQPAQNVRRVPPVAQTAGARKIRPLVYAICIAAIVGTGALTGAYLKTDQQQEAAKQKRQELLQPSTPSSAPQAQTQTQPAVKEIPQADMDAMYAKSLDMLESRRAQLVAQKTGLETKLRDFRENQRRREQEEREKKEFGLKR